MLSAGLAEAVALDGLIWLVLAAFLAGLIRGFSGFWFCDGFSSGCRAICITDLGALDFGGDGFIRAFALIAHREQEGDARPI